MFFPSKRLNPLFQTSQSLQISSRRFDLISHSLLPPEITLTRRFFFLSNRYDSQITLSIKKPWSSAVFFTAHFLHLVSGKTSPKPHPPHLITNFKMPAPAYGALGMTFTVVRGMQAVCLISIIGMTANFISEMVSADNVPPSVLIGTLSVVSPVLNSNGYPIGKFI